MSAPTSRAKQLDAALAALGRNESAEAIARTSGLEERLVRAVVAAKPPDARAVFGPLLDTDHATKLHESRLRSALVWPAFTMGMVLVTSLVVATLAAPAFAKMPRGAGLSMPMTLVPVGVAILALAGLFLASRQRWSLGLVSAWRSLDSHAFCGATVALGRAGVALPSAVRAAAEVCDVKQRAAALALARELEAGAPSATSVEPLLGPVAAKLLVVTAPAGQGLTTLEACATLRGATLVREVRRDAARLSFVGLLLAGLALLATGAAFFQAYVGAL